MNLFSDHEKAHMASKKDFAELWLTNDSSSGIQQGYFISFEGNGEVLVSMVSETEDRGWVIDPDESITESRNYFYWKTNLHT